MRTTVTLDDDVVAALRLAASQRGRSFKAMLNETLRSGLSTAAAPVPYVVPTRRMGARPGLDLDKALALAGDFEDEEILRKMALRK